ncbi:putative serine hydrolase Ecym_6247 [Eremothecium cymbalariae DBVPG|uniref:Serine hydrolase domain-containing protein n=1 Tax=Eremothecium cymbalariae (strain CBS 270.75 / DBVPG 7215 / KCTC 17166 / NRRL Y-17582) TaxID=931890 RepID=G8JVF0_ERECY|nr:hypothetical protein Ecym_6247 [Eremothecium cymbalariae DBVPG\
MTEETEKRVLMLHGYAQSDAIFSSKTGGLRKELIKLGYELYYPCAPIKIDRGGVNEETTYDPTVDGIELHGWWIRDFNGRLQIPHTTYSKIREYIVENGPFEGIIGFSQGAAFAGYLCTNFRKIVGLTKEQQPDLKFFISFSGFRLEPDPYYKQYQKDSINVPSLHIMGELDTVVSEERVMALYDAYPDNSKTLLKHAGGHFVPNSKVFVTKVVNWLKSLDQPSIAEDLGNPKKCEKDGDMPELEEELLNIIDGFGKA